MPATDSLLIASTKAYEAIVHVATESALRSFMASLGDTRCPTRGEVESAMKAARGNLKEHLLDRATIDILSGEWPIDDVRIDAIALSASRHLAPLQSPPVPVFTVLDVSRLASAALLGAVLGALLGSFVGIYFLAMREVGLLIGAPIGAFTFTWGLDTLSRSPGLSRTLMVGLAAATMSEAWAYLSVNPITEIWRKLSGRGSIRRIAAFASIICLLAFARRRVTYDSQLFKEAVGQAIEDWLYGAILTLAVVIQDHTNSPHSTRSNKEAIAELGNRIMELNLASAKDKLGLIDDVIEAARNAGFEGLAPGSSLLDRNERSVLKWLEPMRERYDSFGYVEDGDTVLVEREPVIKSGELLKKGLVRKQRGN